MLTVSILVFLRRLLGILARKILSLANVKYDNDEQWAWVVPHILPCKFHSYSGHSFVDRVILFCRSMEGELFIEEVAAEIEIGGGGEVQEAAEVPTAVRLPFGIQVEDMGLAQGVMHRKPHLQAVLQQLSEGMLAKGTMKSYSSALAKFDKFCLENGHILAGITEDAMMEYILELAHKKASFHILSQVRPALKAKLELQKGNTDDFTLRLDRLLEGALREAASRKEPTKKATEISLDLLKRLMGKFVLLFRGREGEADIYRLRTVCRVVVEYFTFCRGADYAKLQLKHLKQIGEDIQWAS